MYSAVDLILSFLFFTKIRIHVAKANGRKVKSPAIPKNNEAFWKRAEDGTRTRDPNLGKVMLYQLSYFRIKSERKTGLEPATLTLVRLCSTK